MEIKSLLKKVLDIRSAEEAQKEILLANGMKVGKNTNIYSWSGIDPTLPYLIEIGDDVTISSDVRILTHDASPCKVGCGTKLGRVTIGNNVFIGAKSLILCNTRIGDNVIVGAGSIVTRDLPSGGVYAGSPARLICSFDDYKERMTKLRSERPDLSKVRPWDTWQDATEEERKYMYDSLEDGFGFF